MAQQNAFNSLVQTGLGSPLLSSAQVVNVWQHIQAFEQLPVLGAPTAADNLDWELIGQGAAAAFDVRGGIEVETGAGQGDLAAVVPQTTATQTALQAIEWITSSDLIFDAAVRFDGDNLDDLLVAAGFKLTSVAAVATDDDQLIFSFDAPGGETTILAVSSVAGVDVIVDTGILIEADRQYRLTILTGGPTDSITGQPLARFLIDGQRVADIPAPLPAITTMKPRLVLQKLDAAAVERQAVIHGLRVGKKFRA